MARVPLRPLVEFTFNAFEQLDADTVDSLRNEDGMRDFVRRRRAGGASWPTIRDEIVEATEGLTTVTHQTIREWYREGQSSDSDS